MENKKIESESSAAQGSVYLITSDGRTLSLPIPSKSPCDPLNWSTWRQWIFLVAISFFTVVGLILAQGTSMFLPDLAVEYAAELPTSAIRLDMVSSIPSLFWGIGALVWVPVSIGIGKRPVFLICSILLTVATLWAALSKTIASHLGARCLQGFAGSISPSVMLLSLIDMAYIHQRPQYLAAFWCVNNAMSNFGLAFTPFIIHAGGSWRAFYWVWLAPCILSILAALLLSPETSFRRPAMAFNGRILAQRNSGTVKIYEKWNEVPEAEHFRVEWPSREKCKAIPQQMFSVDSSRIEGRAGIAKYFRQLVYCALNPLILWSLTLSALVFGTMIITCFTYVQVLMSEPYMFTPNTIGLVKIATGIGAIFAYPISGPLVNRICRILTTRNRGVREPEHYLPSLIVPTLACCISLALYGTAIELQWKWELIILFVAINYFSAIAMFTANTLWIIESFPKSPALVIMGAGGYGVSFALSGGIVPWIHGQGFAQTYVELSFVIGVVACMSFPFFVWGKSIREVIYSKWSSHAYVAVNAV